MRFCHVSATPRPKARLPSVSIAQASGQSGIGRPSSQTNTATENTISATASADGFQRPALARGQRADQHQHGNGRDQPEMRQRHAEQRDRDQADQDGPGMKARHRRAVDGERAQRDDQAEAGEQRADQGREQRRPHAMHVAQCCIGCDSPMKPSATAMKNSPDQKSFGERMRITSTCHAPRSAAAINPA